MTESRIYHVGIVVAEMEPAMAELTAVTGVSWGRVQRAVPVPFDTPAGPQTWNVTFVYSTEPPYLELIQQVEGTVWENTGFHHLAIWSEDVNAESIALQAQGCNWQAAMSDGAGGRIGGCYHLLDAASCRIELSDARQGRTRMARYLAGSDYLGD
jgi:hypothetical protein